MEWNVLCLYMVQALFSHRSFDLSTSEDMPPVMALFLAFVLLAVPLYGQLRPKKVPFLTAYRPYAGNWRFSWHIVDAKARDKLRRLKVLEGIFVTENARTIWGSSLPSCDQLEDFFTGNMVFFPHFRPLIPVVEKLQALKGWKTHHDYFTLFSECFFNAVFGWSLGTGWYVRGGYFKAMTQVCGFLPGECYIAVFEPHGLLNHTSEWHVVDITDPSVKIIHGRAPYAELEAFQPTGMTPEMLEQWSVLGDSKLKKTQ